LYDLDTLTLDCAPFPLANQNLLYILGLIAIQFFHLQNSHLKAF
jgi:hypothetical protein